MSGTQPASAEPAPLPVETDTQKRGDDGKGAVRRWPAIIPPRLGPA